MGTDIHFVVQKRVNDKWENLTNDRCDYDAVDADGEHTYPTVKGEFHWQGDRNYYTFAWLADVRNGYGFAGVKTFEPVKPVTSDRGLPDDFEYVEPKYDEESGEYEPGGTDLGDHSQGWALASEILAHPRPPILQGGVLELKDYYALRDEGKKPESWSGWISGPGVVVVDAKDLHKRMDATHVSANWVQEKDYLDPLVDSMRECAEKYGADNVRIVFGFDS